MSSQRPASSAPPKLVLTSRERLTGPLGGEKTVLTMLCDSQLVDDFISASSHLHSHPSQWGAIFAFVGWEAC